MVASRVGQDDVAVLGQLADVDMLGPECHRGRHRVLLVGEAGAGQVQVQVVEVLLLRLARNESEADLRRRTRQEQTARILDRISAEHAAPESG